ncbi:hypothetical protein CEXT_82091 [Caerostris extrusa]|uniref:Uncharacterized protein n=1 Tax=Caerostris extrusa TaxID=172846 RepID=A0AAV4YDS7_CAEEX|nr:hypothetical protein CEXT_82091 [Caerostris extrusa]
MRGPSIAGQSGKGPPDHTLRQAIKIQGRRFLYENPHSTSLPQSLITDSSHEGGTSTCAAGLTGGCRVSDSSRWGDMPKMQTPVFELVVSHLGSD